jgi:hypothetical protein
MGFCRVVVGMWGVVGLACLLPTAAAAEPATAAAAAAAAEPQAPAEAVADAGPRVLVPTLLGVDVKKGTAAHKLLLTELVRELGPRLVPAADLLEAQVELGLVAADLATSAGLTKLATATRAERAITVTVDDALTTVQVYASLEGAPPLVLELPRKKKDLLDVRWAKATASAIATRASDALAARVEAPMMDLSEPEPEPKVEAPPPPPPPKPSSSPWLMGAVGGGVALRSVEVTGPLAAKVSPMEQGASPSVSGYLAVRPLVLVDDKAWWNDLLIEAWGRRGVLDARAGDAVCAVDDDDVTMAVSWRARLSEEAYVPRVGGGMSAGLERFAISGCPVPALSTSSTQAAGFVRLAQPLLPGLVEADLLGGLRVPLVGGGSGFARPGVMAQLAINATPIPALPFLFVRGVARVFDSQLTQGPGPDLVVSDLRTSFELQLGGAL